jgi:hypothetical protein
MNVESYANIWKSYHSYMCASVCVYFYNCFFFTSVQLLHKLSIHADDGPMKLMKVYMA